MTTDELKNAEAFARSPTHEGDLRGILNQSLHACQTLEKEIQRLREDNRRLETELENLIAGEDL